MQRIGTVEAAVSAALPQMQAPRLPLQRLLWRERGDYFLKARIAAQLVPKREQFQLAIAERTWEADDAQLFAFSPSAASLAQALAQGATKFQPEGRVGPSAVPTRTLLFMYQIVVW